MASGTSGHNASALSGSPTITEPGGSLSLSALALPASLSLAGSAFLSDSPFLAPGPWAAALSARPPTSIARSTRRRSGQDIAAVPPAVRSRQEWAGQPPLIINDPTGKPRPVGAIYPARRAGRARSIGCAAHGGARVRSAVARGKSGAAHAIVAQPSRRRAPAGASRRTMRQPRPGEGTERPAGGRPRRPGAPRQPPDGRRCVTHLVDGALLAAADLERTFPATDPQQEIWAASRLGDDASCSFNESVLVRLRGVLDVAALHHAVGRLV